MRRIIGLIGAALAIIVAGVTSAGSAGAHGLGIQETNRTDIVELAASASVGNAGEPQPFDHLDVRKAIAAEGNPLEFPA